MDNYVTFLFVIQTLLFLSIVFESLREKDWGSPCLTLNTAKKGIAEDLAFYSVTKLRERESAQEKMDNSRMEREKEMN